MKKAIKVLAILHLISVAILSICPLVWMITIPIIILDAVTIKRVKSTMKSKTALIVFTFLFGSYLIGILLCCYKEEKTSCDEEVPLIDGGQVEQVDVLEEIEVHQDENVEEIQVNQVEVVDVKEIKSKKPMHITGRLSIIFSSIGLGLIFISFQPLVSSVAPTLSSLTMTFILAGFVLGIVSTAKKSTKAGLILAGVDIVLVVTLTVVIIVLWLLGNIIPIVEEIIGKVNGPSGDIFICTVKVLLGI